MCPDEVFTYTKFWTTYGGLLSPPGTIHKDSYVGEGPGSGSHPWVVTPDEHLPEDETSKEYVSEEKTDVVCTSSRPAAEESSL